MWIFFVFLWGTLDQWVEGRLQKIGGGPRLHPGKQEEELTNQNKQLCLFSPLESLLDVGKLLSFEPQLSSASAQTMPP